ncbi:MAG: phage antirepressor N-terminal domain-containing protein [Chloroflexales bacterium]
MSPDETALVPFDVRAIDFYGDAVEGVLVRVGGAAQIYVPIRPICDFLGLTWSGQFERIRRDEVLAEMIRGVRVTRTPQEGGEQEMLCLPLEYLPGWLFGISAARVREDLRERIILYKRECYRRLWEAFKPEILAVGETDITAPPRSGAELAYEIATAVQHLARQQMEIEARLTRASQWAKTVDVRLGEVDAHVGEVDARLSALEIQVSPQQPISEAQAADLALAVKTVASALEQRGARNGYQRVYGELYRRYEVTSYKSLPRSSIAAVMDWLKAWHADLTAGDGAPA